MATYIPIIHINYLIIINIIITSYLLYLDGRVDALLEAAVLALVLGRTRFGVALDPQDAVEALGVITAGRRLHVLGALALLVVLRKGRDV